MNSNTVEDTDMEGADNQSSMYHKYVSELEAPNYAETDKDERALTASFGKVFLDFIFKVDAPEKAARKVARHPAPPVTYHNDPALVEKIAELTLMVTEPEKKASLISSFNSTGSTLFVNTVTPIAQSARPPGLPAIPPQ